MGRKSRLKRERREADAERGDTSSRTLAGMMTLGKKLFAARIEAINDYREAMGAKVAAVVSERKDPDATPAPASPPLA
jgi:hypothetical protein